MKHNLLGDGAMGWVSTQRMRRHEIIQCTSDSEVTTVWRYINSIIIIIIIYCVYGFFFLLYFYLYTFCTIQ